MAARARAQERDFNRRRSLILDKGFELARNQLDTRLGRCLVHDNIKEVERLQDVTSGLRRRNVYALQHQDARLRRFIIGQHRVVREPMVLCEREPQPQTVEDMLETTRPRYMRRRENQRCPSPQFNTLSVFRADLKRNLNFWETPQKTRVRFRAAVSPTPMLTADEFCLLRDGWRKQQFDRERCLTPPSVAMKKNRTPRVAETPRHPETESPDQEVFVTRVKNKSVRFDSPVPPRSQSVVSSICKEAESVAILEQVIRSRSR